MKPIKWGILSTAKIGAEKIIPAIQQAANATVEAIASRSLSKARNLAEQLQIPNCYGSYGALLAEASVDAIYNPLPNHLHVPKTIEALQANKHVLCEKPIALNSREAQELVNVSRNHPELKVMEAFMYRFHPQWKKAKSWVDNGKIGKLQTIESFFSYHNDDPENIRNKAEMGGGALMDIGCYCISLARFLFGREPLNINGEWKIDSSFGVDYLASGVMDFNTGTATFSCASQMTAAQRVNIAGTEGRIVIDIPFNAPTDENTQIWLYRAGNKKEITFAPVNQYQLQVEAFSDAILNNSAAPIPPEDALNNMKVIDRFKKSARKSRPLSRD